MSYRDLRNFTEMLRALGYPALISMESFRIPNFPLVADLIIWLSKRLDPDADIPTEINLEDERVALIRAAAQFMALKINVKLNTKRLYQADGYAVKELLKISTLLYDALRNSNLKNEEEESDDNIMSLREFDISDKISDLKQSRQLATEITTNGAALFDLLGKEVDLRSLRHISVGRQFELSEVETGVKNATEAVRQEIEETKQLINNVSNTENNLDTKIERRKIELDRYEKRLQTLKKVKPAFLEEFSRAEEELRGLYEEYIWRWRSLVYLEQRFAEVERLETERMQQQLAATRRLVEQLRMEEHSVNTGNIEEEDILEPQPQQGIERPSRTKRTGRLYGTMQPSGPEVATSGSSSETDSDELLLDGEEPELAASPLGSDDDSLALDLSPAAPRAPTAATGRRTSNQPNRTTLDLDSDDDF